MQVLFDLRRHGESKIVVEKLSYSEPWIEADDTLTKLEDMAVSRDDDEEFIDDFNTSWGTSLLR